MMQGPLYDAGSPELYRGAEGEGEELKLFFTFMSIREDVELFTRVLG